MGFIHAHWVLLYSIGAVIYFFALCYFDDTFEDIDPIPLIALLSAPVWPLGLIVIAAFYILSLFGVGSD